MWQGRHLTAVMQRDDAIRVLFDGAGERLHRCMGEEREVKGFFQNLRRALDGLTCRGKLAANLIRCVALKRLHQSGLDLLRRPAFGIGEIPFDTDGIAGLKCGPSVFGKNRHLFIRWQSCCANESRKCPSALLASNPLTTAPMRGGRIMVTTIWPGSITSMANCAVPSTLPELSIRSTSGLPIRTHSGRSF